MRSRRHCPPARGSRRSSTTARRPGCWVGGEGIEAVAEIDAAIDRHVGVSGSDLAHALALAREVIAQDPHGHASIVAITDGVLANAPRDALTVDGRACPAGSTAEGRCGSIDGADLHVIAVDPVGMRATGRDVLLDAAARSRGSYAEVEADDLDHDLTGIADWLAPGWFALATSSSAIPDEVFAGSGFVALSIVHAPKSFVVRGHGAAPFAITARQAPHAPIAQLALARASDDDFALARDREGDDDSRLAAHHRRWQITDRHPAVDDDHAFAILSTSGRVAKDRHRVVAGGGSYARAIELEDPEVPVVPAAGTSRPVAGGSSLDRSIIQRLLVDQLQPHAFMCYQRALGHAPTLAGTATVQLDIARGEITTATIGGLRDPGFDACLLDAAYAIAPPMPTLGYNTDDRSIVNYSLSFTIHDQHPLVIPGDADSSTPIDIDAIQGGAARPRLDLDTRTPLGNLGVP